MELAEAAPERAAIFSEAPIPAELGAQEFSSPAAPVDDGEAARREALLDLDQVGVAWALVRAAVRLPACSSTRALTFGR